MTVGELIEQLQLLPPDRKVFYEEGPTDNAASVELIAVDFVVDTNLCWYERTENEPIIVLL